jgi:hypothetical protein
MTQDTPDSARGGAAGSGDAIYLLSSSAAEVQPNSPPHINEARRQLNLEFLHECAGGIAVHAALVQTFAEIGDAAGACYAMRRLFAHVKAAHPVYVELREEAE